MSRFVEAFEAEPGVRRHGLVRGEEGPTGQRATSVMGRREAVLVNLQRLAGNEAVARMMSVQRGKFSQHAKERGEQRGISNTKMREVMRTGTKYSDPNYEGAIVYYDASTGWAVCTNGGQVITTYNTAAPKARWERK